MAKVLVVDDDADIRKLVELALRVEGIPVDTAENGTQALARMKSGELPSLVLLDLMMPGMDGWALSSAMAADPLLRSIPVVVMTAFEESPRELPSCASVLRKPMGLEAIRNVVRKHRGTA